MFSHLSTPCLLLDKPKLLGNITRMQDKAKAHNVVLRPHMKTAKSVFVADLFDANESQKAPITVSTLREAEYFAVGGYTDILYAVSIEPGKFERAAALLRKGVRLKVILDNINTALVLNEFAKRHDTPFQVLIEVDVDGHRAGCLPNSQELLELAKSLSAAPNIELLGLMTHAGISYDSENIQQAFEFAEQEQQRILHARDRLLAEGIEVNYVTIGSTPTVVAAESFTGIQEIRPGVFVFFDLFQAQMGVCDESDIALSVLCAVTTHKSDQHALLIDAGGLAMSKDRSTAGQSIDYGYGKLVTLEGEETGLIVNAVNQEHGIVKLPEGKQCADYPIGTRFRVLPNHACMTAAAYDSYHVMDANEALANWPRCNGW